MEIVDADQVPDRSRYTWSEWADGQHRRARRGTDYTSTTAAFVSAGRRWADRHSYTWSHTTNGDEVTFTITPRSQPRAD